MRPGDWVDQARCARPEYRDLEWVQGHKSSATKHELVRTRKQLGEICSACPVVVECREFAERTQATIGFWGGKNFNYRFSVRR